VTERLRKINYGGYIFENNENNILAFPI